MLDATLKLSHISKAFAGVQALDNVSMEIPCGGIHCLIGENGSGKSTLVKIISGVYRPDNGEITLHGKTHTHMTPTESIRNGVQIIYQDFSLFPSLKVYENIALNAELSAGRRLVSRRRMRKMAAEALHSIDVAIDLEQRVADLSVANKQLVAISRALLHNARLIIMDEPTTALTKKEVASLFTIIKELQKKGVAILFISHKLDEVFEISQTFTILRSGKHIINGKTADFDREKFIYYMTGRNIQETLYSPETLESQPIMEVRNLGIPNCFENVSFSIRPGEILGITGILGSGRTELALSLYGVHPARSGKIILDGKQVRIRSIQDALRNAIVYLPEDRLTEGLCLPQSILRNIHLSTLGSYRGRFRFLDQDRMQKDADRWIQRFSIATTDTAKKVQALSGGNQQKVILARLLSMKPRVMILNGPTVGVDIGSKFDIHAALRAIAVTGVALIIISDDIPEVLMNCNRILVMKNGRIIREFDNHEVDQEALSSLMVEQA